MIKVCTPSNSLHVSGSSPLSSIDTLKSVVLLVPHATDEGLQRITLKNLSYKGALNAIHNALGCSDVKVFPKLQYKLSTAPVRAEAISLETKDDWNGCLEEVTQLQKKKKLVISVKIIVTSQVRHITTSVICTVITVKLLVSCVASRTEKGCGKVCSTLSCIRFRPQK